MTVVSTPAIRVQFQAHPGQQVIDASDARFRTVVCGRRWGKTKYALNVLFREAMQRKGLYWWTAPTYKIGVKARWHEFCRVFKDFIRYKTETDLWMEMINGSRIYWLSLESYDNIRGEGVDGLIIDEAAQVDERRVTEYRVIWDSDKNPSEGGNK